MSNKIAFVVATNLVLAGCASVPMESTEASNQAKLFKSPTSGNSGLYIYRGGGPGGALKKNIVLDGHCVGETAQNVFFYEEVPGGEHTLSTESEFSPNDLKLVTEISKLYFVEQQIKMGVFVGGAKLRVVDEAEGKAKVSKMGLATKGTCGK